jgi:4-amino-4-deoxy-L-arabinose transferase-like glycosyltransferase
VLERVLAVLTLTAGAVWAAYVLLFGSDAGPPFPVIIALVLGGAAVLVLWALRFGLHLVVPRRARERRRLRRIAAEPIVLLLVFAFVLSGGAFWVRFMLSRSALNRYVQTASPEIASGSFKPGVRVGLFWLREAEVLPHGAVRIITTDCMLVDACGLVYSAAGAPPVVGEDAYETLGGHWYQWHRRF